MNVYLRNKLVFTALTMPRLKKESIIGDILQLRLTYIPLRFELVFYLAVTGWERESIGFVSEIVLWHSSIGVQNIIFEFKIMINE